MAKRLTVVISQGQSANPVKRQLEETLVGGLLFKPGVEVTVIPHLYDLAPDGTGMLCLQGISGDLVVLSWLFPRAAHWTLDRNGIKGHEGTTLLESGDPDGDDEEETAAETADDKPRVGPRNVPNRKIYCLDLRTHDKPEPYLAEIERIQAETSVQTVDLGALTPPNGHGNGNGKGKSIAGLFGIAPQAAPVAAPAMVALAPEDSADSPTSLGAVQPVRVEEQPTRRWYPVIDYSRCTNCMECIDFCLFGVYGVDAAQTILIEQPDNCRKGCPACSRVCPENAIIFPQHKSPAIAGSPDGEAGGLKIDLSKLFGAPDAIEVAALERDVELVAVGRDAVGVEATLAKRQASKPAAPSDDLDSLMDELDAMDL